MTVRNLPRSKESFIVLLYDQQYSSNEWWALKRPQEKSESSIKENVQINVLSFKKGQDTK